MKTINYNDVKNVLSAKELKNLLGGSGIGTKKAWRVVCITSWGSTATTWRCQESSSCESIWQECEFYGMEPGPCVGVYVDSCM